MGGYDLERYLNVRQATGASFGPDGERVAFVMVTTGVDHVWALDAARAWPE